MSDSKNVVNVTNTVWDLLITHPRVQESFKYYVATEQPMRAPKGSSLVRTLTFEGVTYVCQKESANEH